MSVDWFGCAGVKLRQVESLAWVSKERGVKTVELLRADSTRGSDRGDQRACCGRSVRHPARTVLKMLKFSVPPGYVRTKRPFRPKLGWFTGVIEAIPAANKDQPKKQRHTSKRLFERLRDEHGFTDKITIVKDDVAGCRQRTQDMIVPLVHPPGPAQVVFCEAIGVIGGVESNRQGQDRHGSAYSLGSRTTL